MGSVGGDGEGRRDEVVTARPPHLAGVAGVWAVEFLIRGECANAIPIGAALASGWLWGVSDSQTRVVHDLASAPLKPKKIEPETDKAQQLRQ